MEQEQYHTILEVSQLIREKKLSPTVLVSECLERIEKLQPRLNAFITVLKDQALADAQKAEAEIKGGKWRGPLHGIPVAVKDFYDTAGVKTTAGFEHFKDRIPQRDAACVAKLKAAGAIIVGKTNMDQLGMATTGLMSFFGPVHNPWNAEYITGGSSSGSAVAVATSMCFATIDTDAVGSCRLPAACLGVVGYKCTWGLIDNSGILEGEEGDEAIIKLATAAITSRSAEDTALLCDLLVGDEFSRKTKKKRKARLGLVSNFETTRAVRSNFEAAVAGLRNAGYETQKVTAPLQDDFDMTQIDERRKTANETLFKKVDVLVLPTNAAEVPKAQDVGPDPQGLPSQNTFFANYFALPAVSVPCGFDEHGLPIGLQIVGKQQDDDAVLAVAAAFQGLNPWGDRHPNL